MAGRAEKQPSTKTAPAASSTVHFTLQGKGGVGKSLVSALMAQYFREKGSVQCIDTDPINNTLMQYKGLGASHIELMEEGSKIDERKFDGLMERLLTEDGIFVVDNGASSFVPMTNYLIENNAIEMLGEAGRRVFIHCVVTGGQALIDTLNGFKALAEQTPTNNIVVWLNEYFGPIEAQGKAFNEMKVYIENAAKVRGIIRIPKRNADTFGRDMEDMVSAKLTFGEVMNGSGFPIMARQRLKTVQREIYQQLDQVGF